MNCKQGDLAIIIGGNVNSGKIVTCESIASKEDLKELMPNESLLPIWRVDAHLTWIRPANRAQIRAPFCPDKLLRPLKDNDEQDETLTWANVPKLKEITHV